MIWSLRPALPEDAAAMAAVHSAASTNGWSEADFAAWLARAEAFACVAAGEAGLSAFGLALSAGDDAELLMIATFPSVQRRGAARDVLSTLDAEAQRRGLGRWVLEAARDNLAALALYRSEGFVEIAVRPGYYRPTGPAASGPVDALVLARAVGVSGGHGRT
ncbi:MAG: GNAT family N-acetyltransferase [Alphaproteobacteria bacterium]|nr:GNAT family N-acetyltransferase [Alphaproteobacteria bacterium]